MKHFTLLSVLCLAVLGAIYAADMTGNFNTWLGYIAGINSDGERSTVQGAGAGGEATGLIRSDLIGAASGVYSSNLTDCVGIGYRALRGASDMSEVVAIGSGAFSNRTGLTKATWLNGQFYASRQSDEFWLRTWDYREPPIHYQTNRLRLAARNVDISGTVSVNGMDAGALLAGLQAATNSVATITPDQFAALQGCTKEWLTTVERENGRVETFNWVGEISIDTLIEAGLTPGDTTWPNGPVRIVLGRGVTGIDDNTFSNCSTLRELVISPTVMRIGRSALERLGSWALGKYCTIVIPESVENIDGMALSGNQGNTVVFKGRTLDEVQAMPGYPFDFEGTLQAATGTASGAKPTIAELASLVEELRGDLADARNRIAELEAKHN